MPLALSMPFRSGMLGFLTRSLKAKDKQASYHSTWSTASPLPRRKFNASQKCEDVVLVQSTNAQVCTVCHYDYAEKAEATSTGFSDGDIVSISRN